jgi:hypothetical protein
VAYTVVADASVIAAIATILDAKTVEEVGAALETALATNNALVTADLVGAVTAWMTPTSDPVDRPVVTTAAPAPTPVVQFTMNMDVADPAGFAANPDNIAPMEAAVADIASVPLDTVSVTLEVGGASNSTRRLLDARRLQDTYVIVNSEIAVADTTVAAALETTIAAVTPAQMTTSLETALTDAGVNVSALGLNVTSAATVTVTPAPPTSAPGAGQASGAILSCKAFSLAPLFAVSAWLLSHA